MQDVSLRKALRLCGIDSRESLSVDDGADGGQLGSIVTNCCDDIASGNFDLLH